MFFRPNKYHMFFVHTTQHGMLHIFWRFYRNKNKTEFDYHAFYSLLMCN